jgi:hypothetical protein
MKRLLTFSEGIGSVGALFAAIAARVTFLFARGTSAVGLVTLGNTESFAQGFALLSLVGRSFGKVGETRPAALSLPRVSLPRSDRELAPRLILTWRWIRIRQEETNNRSS